MTESVTARAARRRPSLGAVATGIGSAALVAYPLVAWLGLGRGAPRAAALGLLVLVAPAGVARLRALRDNPALSAVAYVPLAAVALLVAGAALDRAGFVLAVPSVINILLLASVVPTLVAGPPMIERFARLQHPDLTPDEVRWCRAWTIVWCTFFALNASIAAALAVWAPTLAWSAYTGGISWALIAALIGTEWTIRKLRFQRFGDNPVDRLFARALTATGQR